MNELTLQEMSLRMSLALLLGLVLGYEREQHGRAAGMRTTMLVCMASAVVMMLSQHLFAISGTTGMNWRPDPARLAAGVLAGMGFLGAGVIIQQDNAVYGVTTAAVLWFSSILGMAFGAGFISLGLMGFAAVLLALFILPAAERRILSDRYAHLEVWVVAKGPSQDEVQKAVEALGFGAHLKPVGLQYDGLKRLRTMRFDVKTKNHHVAEIQAGSVARVAAMKGVIKVSWS